MYKQLNIVSVEYVHLTDFLSNIYKNGNKRNNALKLSARQKSTPMYMARNPEQ